MDVIHVLASAATLNQAVVAGFSGLIERFTLLYQLGFTGSGVIQVLAVCAAVWHGFVLLTTQNYVMSYWGIFQGDIVAITSASTIGFVIIGGLRACDFFFYIGIEDVLKR